MPAHVNETTEKVDNLGGILSAVLVGALILGINFAPVPNAGSSPSACSSSRSPPGVAFVIRQRRAANPLYDLNIASRRVFWVAAVAGIIVFGSLMGAMFIGQQYLQNVLAYSTLDAGAGDHPGRPGHGHRRAALGQARRGARRAVHAAAGYVFVLLGFLTMLLLWKDGRPIGRSRLGYAFVGIGVGFAGTPASHSLTGSVPVTRAGMASGRRISSATSVARSCSRSSARC